MKQSYNKVLAILLCFCTVFCMLVGCGSSDSNAPAETPASSIPSAPTIEEPTEVTDAPNTAPEKQTTVLYIGNQTAGFTEYPMTYEGELIPEMLLQGIADLTGWNLSLADEITSGKGGMTVTFGPDACLFTGPPEEQKDEFRVYDSLGLTFMALDSIQKTLQSWASPTNPDSVDIYFAASGDVPMELPELGITWPIEQPYSHGGLEAILMQNADFDAEVN